MPSVLETLRERGFVQQCTDESGLQELLGKEAVNFYCGFDPTAESLHCGSLMPIMAMAHLQRAGHKPIAIIGGGTAMIGDPSGKTELRKMLTPDEIVRNGQGILGQLQRYLTLDGTKGLFVNNADWLMPLRYIDFLREIGRHFKVNEMIRAEAYRQRLEREEGLTFIEFNYQLLQAYDYLLLHREQSCRLQIGGDDQWSNILAGLDLIRKDQGKQSYGLTFPLLTTARGEKMGKTAGGAVWLSAERTSSYDFYQYWVNTDDRDVPRFLAYFTFLPMDEVRRLSAAEGAAINAAKRVLAYEATKLCHGEEEAEKAKKAAGIFGGGDADLSAIPTTLVEEVAVKKTGLNFADLLVKTGLADSRKSAKRLIEQGGAYVDGTAISDVNFNVEFTVAAKTLRQGKKKYHRVVLSENNQFYSNLAKEWEQRSLLAAWEGMSYGVCSGDSPRLTTAATDSLESLHDWLFKRVFPSWFPQIQDPIENFRLVLNDFLATFRSRLHTDYPDPQMLVVEKFYRISHHDHELYHRLLDEYMALVWLIEDLFLELTRAANLLCERIREHIDPEFRTAQGALIVRTGPGPDGQEQMLRPEYRLQEKTSRPYPGLTTFRSATRFQREFCFGKKD